MPRPPSGAKKYLLYIYNPEFDKEPRGAKSGLVNKLLNEYYKKRLLSKKT